MHTFLNTGPSNEPPPDQKYQAVIECCLEGESVETRNSKVRRAIGLQMTFVDTPLVSIRKTAWKNALREWEWFMSGSDNINDLHPSVQHWWRPWADVYGRVKYNYSQQMRRFAGNRRSYSDEYSTDPVDDFLFVDQVQNLVDGLKYHPNSRRLVLTTWNAAEMAQPDCPITSCHHTLTQCFVVGGDRLRMETYQRSVDVICGLPHNWIQTAAFQLWLCAQTGLKVDRLVWKGGDCHVYDAHAELAQRMLEAPLPEGPAPQLVYTPTRSDFHADDFTLSEEYRPLLTDKAEMIV